MHSVKSTFLNHLYSAPSKGAGGSACCVSKTIHYDCCHVSEVLHERTKCEQKHKTNHKVKKSEYMYEEDVYKINFLIIEIHSTTPVDMCIIK